MDSNFEAVNIPRQPIGPETISPSLFAHFVLRSSNRPAMKDWYQTVLAARVVFENDYICFLTYDDEQPSSGDRECARSARGRCGELGSCSSRLQLQDAAGSFCRPIVA